MEDEHRRALLHHANLLAGMAFLTVGAVSQKMFFSTEIRKEISVMCAQV